MVLVSRTGLSEPLKWLAENLEEVALDQEAEGFDPTADGTPLVTITQDSAEAMENDLFKKVLNGVGLAPPFDEQVSCCCLPALFPPCGFLILMLHE